MSNLYKIQKGNFLFDNGCIATVDSGCIATVYNGCITIVDNGCIAIFNNGCIAIFDNESPSSTINIAIFYNNDKSNSI